MRLKVYICALHAALFAILLALSPASAGQMSLLGAGKTGAAAVTYVGPMDAYVGTPYAFYSCARVATAALASTATTLCDIVATTGGAAVCTLRGTASGFVDLAGSYCAGTTPAAACAAASGGSCRVTKAYNQITPGTADVVNATLSEMPPLVFSTLNGLPAFTCASANTSRLLSSSTVTLAQPITYGTVARAVGTNTSAFIGSNSTPPGLDGGGGANIWQLTSDAVNILTQAATDNDFHFGMGLLTTSPNSFISIDGAAATTGNAGTNGYSAANISICRANGDSQNAEIMESMIWSSAANTSTNITAVNDNAHSTNGYCAANGCTFP